jgi:hypothetical protein
MVITVVDLEDIEQLFHFASRRFYHGLLLGLIQVSVNSLIAKTRGSDPAKRPAHKRWLLAAMGVREQAGVLLYGLGQLVGEGYSYPWP